MAVFMLEPNRNGNDRVAVVAVAAVVFRRSKVSKKNLITIYDYYANLRMRAMGWHTTDFAGSRVFLSEKRFTQLLHAHCAHSEDGGGAFVCGLATVSGTY